MRLYDEVRTCFGTAGTVLGGRARRRGVILDELCLVTGYQRKYGIEVLRGRQLRPVRRRRRAREYDHKVESALKVLWEASDYICAERLQPFLRDLSTLLERHRDLRLSDEVRAKLGRISVSSVKRAVRRFRGELLDAGCPPPSRAPCSAAKCRS